MLPNTFRVHTEYVLVKSVVSKVLWVESRVQGLENLSLPFSSMPKLLRWRCVVSLSVVPSGNFTEIIRTVTCMVLKAKVNDKRTSGPRSTTSDRSPTLLTSAWFGCHSKTIALTSAHFFKRSLMADVSIGPLSFSSCSEGDTFRLLSWCSSFKISWSYSVVRSSSCPIMSSSMSSIRSPPIPDL
ncbi:uncharacterized protein TNCV_1297671 [Trichonephila clavipes]|nr:uncharacterized protein TNCV_1297671 [Trichonephila clavipes]